MCSSTWSISMISNVSSAKGSAVAVPWTSGSTDDSRSSVTSPSPCSPAPTFRTISSFESLIAGRLSSVCSPAAALDLPVLSLIGIPAPSSRRSTVASTSRSVSVSLARASSLYSLISTSKKSRAHDGDRHVLADPSLPAGPVGRDLSRTPGCPQRVPDVLGLAVVDAAEHPIPVAVCSSGSRGAPPTPIPISSAGTRSRKTSGVSSFATPAMRSPSSRWLTYSVFGRLVPCGRVDQVTGDVQQRFREAARVAEQLRPRGRRGFRRDPQ